MGNYLLGDLSKPNVGGGREVKSKNLTRKAVEQSDCTDLWGLFGGSGFYSLRDGKLLQGLEQKRDRI